MNSYFIKFFDWLKTFPTWSRIIVLALLAALAFFFSSCTRMAYVTAADGKLDGRIKYVGIQNGRNVVIPVTFEDAKDVLSDGRVDSL